MSHTKLLRKIRYYGNNGKTITWIRSGSRSKQVVVNGQSSRPVDVLPGVPQGTVLGPMFFRLYTNNVNEGVNSQMCIFADDNIVYRKIQTSAADHSALESDLNKLHRWARRGSWTVMCLKCAVLSITTKRKPSTYDYYMDDQEIPRTDNQAYL